MALSDATLLELRAWDLTDHFRGVPSVATAIGDLEASRWISVHECCARS